MPFLNMDSGDLVFSDGFCLRAGMSAQELTADQAVPPLDGEAVLLLPARGVRGGSVAPVCEFQHNGLCRVTLAVDTVGGRTERNAGRQRAFLFSLLCLRDPCPDTRRCVRVRCPFGEALLFSDPYTGYASARLLYALPR